MSKSTITFIPDYSFTYNPTNNTFAVHIDKASAYIESENLSRNFYDSVIRNYDEEFFDYNMGAIVNEYKDEAYAARENPDDDIERIAREMYIRDNGKPSNNINYSESRHTLSIDEQPLRLVETVIESFGGCRVMNFEACLSLDNLNEACKFIRKKFMGHAKNKFSPIWYKAVIPVLYKMLRQYAVDYGASVGEFENITVLANGNVIYDGDIKFEFNPNDYQIKNSGEAVFQVPDCRKQESNMRRVIDTPTNVSFDCVEINSDSVAVSIVPVSFRIKFPRNVNKAMIDAFKKVFKDATIMPTYAVVKYNHTNIVLLASYINCDKVLFDFRNISMVKGNNIVYKQIADRALGYRIVTSSIACAIANAINAQSICVKTCNQEYEITRNSVEKTIRFSLATCTFNLKILYQVLGITPNVEVYTCVHKFDVSKNVAYKLAKINDETIVIKHAELREKIKEGKIYVTNMHVGGNGHLILDKCYIG